ncbi:MAG: hypothetical protein IIA45_06840 [Bacteroidetes bacterium]|nr:hypothetical protein [Bacteroidota bacterium]
MKGIIISTLLLFIISDSFAQKKSSVISYWKDGLVVESSDGKFKSIYGGRIMYDVAFFFQDDWLEENIGHLNNGTEFRRARMYTSGTMYERTSYKIEMDFAGGSVAFKDVYIDIKKIPVVGTLRLGNFKEPFRLDVLTSSRFMSFMERATIVDFFVDRNTGFMLKNDLLEKRMSWQAGVFRRATAFGDDEQANDGYNLTGRITGLPILNEDSTKLLHLGAAYSFRKPDDHIYRVSSKPEANLGLNYADTDSMLGVDAINLVSAEASLIYKRYSLQTEYVGAAVHSRNDSLGPLTHNFSAFYITIGVFLTGESKNYISSYKGFGRVNPKKNFGKDGGIGAWELVIRSSNISLASGNLNGGTIDNLAAGVNWYLNPATRITLNYIYSTLNRPIGNIFLFMGSASIIQMRFQVDF